jgi:uncharacterized membrane protein
LPHRRIILVLVTALTVLTALVAVVMVFQSLFAALGDLATARVLSGVGIACLVILVVDVLLLVGALGMLAVREREDDNHRGDSNG